MGIYNSAPVARTFVQDKPTLLVCWWCTLFAATIMAARVGGRWSRTKRLFVEDWIALATLVPLFARMACVHVVLLYGTNNALEPGGGWSDEDVRRKVVGSRLVLASRVFYAATLWMFKLTISEFFKRLTIQIWRRSYEIILRCIRYLLLFSFLAVVLSDLLECRPITLAWRIEPLAPPQCRQGFAQLLTMGIANMLTDLALVAFPLPIIMRSRMPLLRKVQLTLLFSVSLLPVTTTAYRVPTIISRHGVQQYRSLWAGIEILLAATVANALVLGSFVRDRGVKKIRWDPATITSTVAAGRTGSIVADSLYGAQVEPRHSSGPRISTALTAYWGSDEDLVRGLGIANPHGLVASQTPTPADPLRRPPVPPLSNETSATASGASSITRTSTASTLPVLPIPSSPGERNVSYAASGNDGNDKEDNEPEALNSPISPSPFLNALSPRPPQSPRSPALPFRRSSRTKSPNPASSPRTTHSNPHPKEPRFSDAGGLLGPARLLPYEKGNTAKAERTKGKEEVRLCIFIKGEGGENVEGEYVPKAQGQGQEQE